MKITNLHAIELLDSRGNPTVEAEVILENGGATSRYVQFRVSADDGYPPIEDQLDMMYKDQINNTTTWRDAITAIKNKYRKPE